jgi:hypothetical protein
VDHDLSLDLVGHSVHSLLGVPRARYVSQGPLLAVLDRLLPSDPWIVGALISPTERAAARAAGTA